MRRLPPIVLLVLASACSSGEEKEVDITGDWQLVSGSVSGRPIPIVDGSPITLRVAGTEISGSSACNQYGGAFALTGSSISFGDISSTLMACEPEVMDSEIAYMAALEVVDTATVAATELVLTGGDAELRFVLAG